VLSPTFSVTDCLFSFIDSAATDVSPEADELPPDTAAPDDTSIAGDDTNVPSSEEVTSDDTLDDVLPDKEAGRLPSEAPVIDTIPNDTQAITTTAAPAVTAFPLPVDTKSFKLSILNIALSPLFLNEMLLTVFILLFFSTAYYIQFSYKQEHSPKINKTFY